MWSSQEQLGLPTTLTSKLATLPFVQTKDISEIKKKNLDLCGTNAHSSGNASNGWE